MSDEIKKFFSTYTDFVTKVTSDPSMDLESLKKSFIEIEENSDIKTPRLLTAALGLGSETGEFVEIVKKAKIARKSGVVSLEKELNTIDDNFLKNGIELAINERDSKRLRTFLALEIDNIERRHASGQEIFFYMGAYAPAFGMLGTVLGLIIMMKNFAVTQSSEMRGIEFNIAERFADLLGGMGLALITTFYGV